MGCIGWPIGICLGNSRSQFCNFGERSSCSYSVHQFWPSKQNLINIQLLFCNIACLSYNVVFLLYYFSLWHDIKFLLYNKTFFWYNVSVLAYNERSCKPEFWAWKWHCWNQVIFWSNTTCCPQEKNISLFIIGRSTSWYHQSEI